MPNYGDVALDLKPDFDRRKLHDKKQGMWTVGHLEGVSDATLKEEPNKRNQFAWIDKRYHDELAMHLMAGFEFVTKDRWNINETLWQWNAEGHCYNQGQLLMARPAALYFEQRSARDRELNSREDKESEAAREAALRAGIEYEEDDKPVRSAKK